MSPSPDRDAVRVRLGAPGDADVLAAFNRAMARETEGRDLAPATVAGGVRAALADDAHGFYVVAEDDSGVVGALLVTFEWSDWRAGRFWWIQSVYVRPDRRGRGVYRTLHEFVRERARRAGGVCGLRLYVERDNRAAQAVYAALGMAPTLYLIYEEPLG